MFTYYMPTQVFFGKNCIAESGQVLASLGKRALLVTGRHSAKVNGSQDAITGKLDELGIAWYLFDDVENNPSIDTIRRAASLAKEKGVDFVIGIGGGSPMDAAKAIALLCTDDLDDERLFKGPYKKPLPIVAVPTTAGTGSEVTKVSVLTNVHAGTKQSINTPFIFPVYAFADPTYTESVSQTVTIDTAIDALSHAVEGYMSTMSTPMSDVWAEEAMRLYRPPSDRLEGGSSLCRPGRFALWVYAGRPYHCPDGNDHGSQHGLHADLLSRHHSRPGQRPAFAGLHETHGRIYGR